MKHRSVIRLFALILASLFLPYSTAFALPADNIAEINTDYWITEPYEYPVLPGSDEWNALPSTLASKIEVCHVPQDVLEHMTTPALLETVITYPLFSNIYAFNTLAQGLSYISGYFGGIQELLSRPDASQVISLYSSAHAYFVQDIYETNLDARLQTHRLETLLSLSNDSIQLLGCDRPGTGVAENYIVTPFRLKTDPNYTVVSVIVNRTYAASGSSYSDERDQIQDFLRTYTSAVQLRDVSSQYNCHSYA